jgi:nucleoside-diphosphate-sugar epimerase
MPKQPIFNIGNGVVTPFDEVLAAVKGLFPSLRHEIEQDEPPQSKSDPLDISAAKEHLGWEPRFSIRAAFEDFLAELKAARA